MRCFGEYQFVPLEKSRGNKTTISSSSTFIRSKKIRFCYLKITITTVISGYKYHNHRNSHHSATASFFRRRSHNLVVGKFFNIRATISMTSAATISIFAAAVSLTVSTTMMMRSFLSVGFPQRALFMCRPRRGCCSSRIELKYLISNIFWLQLVNDRSGILLSQYLPILADNTISSIGKYR